MIVKITLAAGGLAMSWNEDEYLPVHLRVHSTDGHDYDVQMARTEATRLIEITQAMLIAHEETD